jgi:hypothetical protein
MDRGDLRIGAGFGRLLLESHDQEWVILEGLANRGGAITFSTPGGRQFTGRISGDEIIGTVADPDGLAFPWRAVRIQQGTDRWPVRPRIVVRQLLLGTSASSSEFPTEWRKAVSPRSALLVEQAAMAAAVGLSPADPTTIAARAGSIALGFDTEGRRAAAAMLTRIADSPVAGSEFRSLFLGPGGEWRLDLHAVARQAAAEQVAPATLAAAPLVRLLALLGTPVEGNDSAGLSQVLWHYWQLSSRDRSALVRLSGAADPEIARAATGLAALLGGYDLAEQWWLEAVNWLMTNRWIEADSEWLSPVDLVARFWEADSLTLPPLVARHFGSPQAVPVIGGAGLGSRLLRGANAIGAEFIAQPGAFGVALDAWRGLEFVESTPLRLVLGGRTIVLASPASVARSRLGGFLASADAIEIESGIMPVLAVGTVIHEWQHLLLEGARLNGSGAPGLLDEGWGLRLLEGDPWLAEGAAEWMTERVLAPGGPSVVLIGLMEAEKRLSIASRVTDDTHTLGYLLVRAAANRLDDPAALRRLLVASLHDPRAIASVAGFSGPVTEPLERPATLLMIPEVSYTLDGDVADGADRRLVLPDPKSEP